jgi:hypothetical protein
VAVTFSDISIAKINNNFSNNISLTDNVS